MGKFFFMELGNFLIHTHPLCLHQCYKSTCSTNPRGDEHRVTHFLSSSEHKLIMTGYHNGKVWEGTMPMDAGYSLVGYPTVRSVKDVGSSMKVHGLPISLGPSQVAVMHSTFKSSIKEHKAAGRNRWVCTVHIRASLVPSLYELYPPVHRSWAV